MTNPQTNLRRLFFSILTHLALTFLMFIFLMAGADIVYAETQISVFALDLEN